VYKLPVPNSRSPGQKLIAFPLDEELLSALDSARGPLNRSQFIREALAAKLGLAGHALQQATAAPDRVGKGGPKEKGKAGLKGRSASDLKLKRKRP